MRKLRLPSPAMLVAMVALFATLAGTGYAAVALAPNSVGTAELKNGAVTKAKISRRTRRALKGNVGPVGPQGAQGPQGPQGPAGANGSNGTNGTNGADATRLFARLDAAGTADPTVVSGSGVAGTDFAATGAYRVIFNRAMAGCVPIATLSAPNGSDTPGEINVTLSATNANAVYVNTYNSSGTQTNSLDFTVAVFCP